MRRLHLVFALCLATGLIAGCSDSSDDDGNTGTGDDAALTAVVTDLKIPTSETDAAADVNNDQKTENALYNIAKTMTGLGFSLQNELTYEISTANTLIILFQVHADSLDNAASMDIQLRQGKKEGDNEYSIASGSPENAKLSGSISNGSLSAGPADYKFPLPTGLGTVLVTMKNAQVKGTVNANGITGGVIAGAIPWSEITDKAMPSIAQGADAMYKDSATDASTKNALKAFDTNNDGTISADEVSSNAILKAVLAADVDLNGDGTKDALSVGMGFTANKATLK